MRYIGQFVHSLTCGSLGGSARWVVHHCNVNLQKLLHKFKAGEIHQVISIIHLPALHTNNQATGLELGSQDSA